MLAFNIACILVGGLYTILMTNPKTDFQTMMNRVQFFVLVYGIISVGIHIWSQYS